MRCFAFYIHNVINIVYLIIGYTALNRNTDSKDSTTMSTTTKAANNSDASREQSSVATLKVDNTSSSEDAKSVTVVLTQDGPGTSDQLEINQMIDGLVDNGWLSYVNIASLCLSSLEEKNKILKPLADGIKMFQGSK